MKQRIFLLTLLFLLILTRTNDISAKETKLNEDMFTNVENTLKDKEIDLSYTQLVKQLIHGNVKGVLHTIKVKMKEVFLNRMLIQKDLIREILLIAFTAAIFKNLSDSFFQQSTANSAFYITYVILCGVMVHSFFYLNKTVMQLVTLMADYMKGMIMAYSLAVVSTSGITTSTTVYEFYLLLIYAMTTLTNVILLPMIKILFVLKIINHISKEEHFSRLCKTLEGVIKFLLKGFLSVLLGVQLIQSMILPAVDSMKNTVLQKGMSAIPGLGWDIYRIWTMDWWDNKEKELKKLIECLNHKKEAAYDVCAKEEVSTEETEFIKDSVYVGNSESIKDSEIEDTKKIKDIPVQDQEPKITKHFAEQDHVIKPNMNLAKQNQDVESLYHKESYISADLIMTDISTDEYVQSKNKKMITEKIQQIIDTEAPVSYDTLVKKTLRAFNIARSSHKTLEATQKALKAANTKMNKQQGIKFYWRKDQDPSAYYSFREDKNTNTRRSANDICQQELKNAVCMTLLEKGRIKKEDLIKATIRTMGYARSSNVLTSAVERGLKYGQNTGEIVETGEKNVFEISR